MTHLWESGHDYYCNEGNFYSNDCGAHYKRLSEFLEAEGEADLDYNLVFRWDWVEGEDCGAQGFNGDVNYRNGLLKVFFMGQRKGLFRFATVEVCRADEGAVKEYLEPRFKHMMELWSPLSGLVSL